MPPKGFFEDSITSLHINPRVYYWDFNKGEMKMMPKDNIFGDSITAKIDSRAYMDFDYRKLIDTAVAQLTIGIGYPKPKKIIRNGPATIIFWDDNTKTLVKRNEDCSDDPYLAFCAALAKKVYGNNSRVKKLIEEKTVPVKERKEKEAKEK